MCLKTGTGHTEAEGGVAERNHHLVTYGLPVTVFRVSG